MKASNSHGGECLCPVLQALSGTATACSIMPDLKMCLTFLSGCAVIIVLTGVMSYAGLAVQMRHARRSLSRAWQQNMHWTCAKQLSALRYSFLVLLGVTPDSSCACIVDMETIVHMDTIQRASTAATGQIHAGLQNSPIHFIFEIV